MENFQIAFGIIDLYHYPYNFNFIAVEFLPPPPPQWLKNERNT